jgi:hypothetical protein
MKENQVTFQKHILICGKTEKERLQSLNYILGSSDLEVFRFPLSMRSFADYLTFVQSKNLFLPSYEIKGKYNLNQIFDFHIDWIAENNCLFVFEEFQNADEKFRLEILRIMINNLEIHKKLATKIIVLLDEEIELINNLRSVIRATEYKTKNEVIDSNLQIISI